MTPEELEKMAEEIVKDSMVRWLGIYKLSDTLLLVNIKQALLTVQKRTREDCAGIVENISFKYTDDITGRAGEMAKAIRESGEK